MTSHSPDIINFLGIAIQGKYLQGKIENSPKRNELLTRLYDLVPEKSLLSEADLIIYELNELNGSIKKLDTIAGIPSDNNYLNNSLAEGNELFDSLFELEQEL